MNEKKNLSPEPPKRKKKKKTKKLSQTLRAYNSQMRGTILVCGVLRVEDVCTTKVQQGSLELHMRKNCVLVLPVNIVTVWHAGFTWLHDTLPCE